MGLQDCRVGQSSSGNLAWCPRMPHWPLVSAPRPLQKHLSLMKCFPLRGHLAHTATQQLLSDKEGVGGQPTRQVGLAIRLSHLVSEPHSSPSPSSGGPPALRGLCQEGAWGVKLGSRKRGARLPFGVGIPTSLPPFPTALFVPTANRGSQGLCLPACWAFCLLCVASEAQVCP